MNEQEKIHITQFLGLKNIQISRGLIVLGWYFEKCFLNKTKI